MLNKSSATKIAVIFGGRSVEHEISVITALQLLMAIDSSRYEVVPVYIAPSGKWYSGEALLDRSAYRNMNKLLASVDRIIAMPEAGVGGFYKVSRSPFNDSEKLVFSEESFIPVDVCILAFHGEYGEDGCIQGLLEMANIAYTGCDVLGSAVAMNKDVCKKLLASQGIPVLPSVIVRKSMARQSLSQAREMIMSVPGLESFPLFVKPNHLGSSIGVGKAIDEDSLNAALVRVFRFDQEAIVEPAVEQLLEINISVQDGDPAFASCTETPISDSGVLSYEEKYLRGGGKKGGASSGMAALDRVIDPPDLDQRYKDKVLEYALKSFSVLNCGGLVRFDFMLDLASDQLYFNELNPIPGSFSFYLWEKTKPPRLYTENIDQIISTAILRHQSKNELQRDIGLKALKKG